MGFLLTPFTTGFSTFNPLYETCFNGPTTLKSGMGWSEVQFALLKSSCDPLRPTQGPLNLPLSSDHGLSVVSSRPVSWTSPSRHLTLLYEGGGYRSPMVRFERGCNTLFVTESETSSLDGPFTLLFLRPSHRGLPSSIPPLWSWMVDVHHVRMYNSPDFHL